MAKVEKQKSDVEYETRYQGEAGAFLSLAVEEGPGP